MNESEKKLEVEGNGSLEKGEGEKGRESAVKKGGFVGFDGAHLVEKIAAVSSSTAGTPKGKAEDFGKGLTQLVDGMGILKDMLETIKKENKQNPVGKNLTEEDESGDESSSSPAPF